MKKIVLQHDGDGRGLETTFQRAEAIACPFCRGESVWRDLTQSPVQPNEHDDVSFTSYLCETCGMMFSLVLVDPDLGSAFNRANLERFRAAPLLP